MLVHVVFFWLNDDAPTGAAGQLIDDCNTLLKAIPTVHSIEVGKPVPSPRPVVDGSYAVGLLVLFADQAGADVYQDHPKHLEFIARNKAAWKRVQVMDFV